MSKEVSKYVSYKEVIHSNTAVAKGINNEPSDEQLELIRECAKNIFDKLRVAAGGPVKINSVFRSDALNEAIGGSKTSQHSVGLDTSKNSYGAAFDVDDYYYFREGSGTKFDNNDTFYWIYENCDFDQLIAEFPVNGYMKWVHFSYRPDGKNRNQVLIATKIDGRTKYLPYDGNEHLVYKT
jgi:hypothetical protein